MSLTSHGIRLTLLICIVTLFAASPAQAYEPPEPRATIYLDPGHGGPEPGARARVGGFIVTEAEVNLKVALLTAERLRARGFAVALSRETDDQSGGSEDANGDGRVTSRDGMQSVVDMANAARADLFLSIHHNGISDPSVAGSEVYYCADRPFADASFRFGELVLDHVLAALRREGYYSKNRGLKDDSMLFTRGAFRGHLFVLGPVRPLRNPTTTLTPGRSAPKLRATDMPGVLSEALFISNPTEAWLLSQPRIHAAIADAYANAVDDYFAGP